MGPVYHLSGSLRLDSSSTVGIRPSGVTTAKKPNWPSMFPKSIMIVPPHGGESPARGREDSFYPIPPRRVSRGGRRGAGGIGLPGAGEGTGQACPGRRETMELLRAHHVAIIG